MNIVTMLAWLQDVVLSYTEGRPAALILDSYACHFSEDVRTLAAHLNIQLIRIPPGLTSTLQPLDVRFNGPMLALRKKLSHRRKMIDPFSSDSWQSAVERAQLSYDAMSQETTRRAWQACYLID